MSRMSMTKKKRKKLNVEFYLMEGIDEKNAGQDTVTDVTVFSDTKLSHVHDSLLKVFQVNESVSTVMQYYYLDMDEPLNPSLTFASLGVQDGDRIIVDATRKKRKFRMADLLLDCEDAEDDMTVVCYTRIFEADGVPMKRLKVLVRPDQTCEHLLADVSKLWNREGLKFRFGRHVLTPDRTFAEIGMQDLDEILVTGARG